jgi:hypothetical protein
VGKDTSSPWPWNDPLREALAERAGMGRVPRGHRFGGASNGEPALQQFRDGGKGGKWPRNGHQYLSSLLAREFATSIPLRSGVAAEAQKGPLCGEGTRGGPWVRRPRWSKHLGENDVQRPPAGRGKAPAWECPHPTRIGNLPRRPPVIGDGGDGGDGDGEWRSVLSKGRYALL